MLSKMGFQQGQGIGKDGSGAVNPIGLHVRADMRSGLGKEEEVHRLAEEQFQRQAAEANEMRRSFLSRQRTNFETRQVCHPTSHLQDALFLVYGQPLSTH
jgi:hypothetical protein